METYLGDEAVTPHPLRQGQATGHEHARPVHRMEAQDVLTNDVVGGPTMLPQIVLCRLHSLWQQAWTTALRPCR